MFALTNIRNTWYINTVLQLLASFDFLYHELEQAEVNHVSSKSTFIFIKPLQCIHTLSQKLPLLTQSSFVIIGPAVEGDLKEFFVDVILNIEKCWSDYFVIHIKKTYKLWLELLAQIIQYKWWSTLNEYSYWIIADTFSECHTIGGSRGGARDAPPLWVQILSFSCSFW